MNEKMDVIKQHPCLNKKAVRWFGRIHLPVAPACNIKCRYCTRIYDCANENRPGVCSRVISPEEALERVAKVVEGDQRIRVVGIAGPGDPLANKATLTTLRLVHEYFPDLIKCISTNGLALEEQLADLADLGVKAVTVTVNTISSRVGGLIYEYVYWQGKSYRGEDAAELLWKKQEDGIRKAAEMGMVVKVNTVLIPGINEQHLMDVARAVKDAGAYLMNVMPLIPQADFRDLRQPDRKELVLARRNLEPIILQMEHCRQCRADAVGML